MGQKYGPKIVTDGLVLCLDAHDAKSYAGEPTTNLLLYPESINSGPTQESWSGTITQNAVTAPDGTLTATKIEATSGYVYEVKAINTNYNGVSFGVGDTITYSVWIKMLDGTQTASYGPYIWNYNNPTYGIVARDLSGLGSEWKLYKMSHTVQSHQTSFAISYSASNGGVTGTYAIWHPQLEVKSYNTPYVETSRSATDGWKDRTANSNDGTLTNMAGTGVSHYRAGQVIMPVSASYLDFDGTNDYVDLGTTAGNFGTDPFTVSVWLKFDVITNFFNKRAADQDQIFFGFSGGKPYFIYNAPNGTDYGYTVSNTSLSTGVWYNLVATVDRSSVYPVIYVNGSNDGSSSQSSAGSPTTANMDNGGSLYLGRWTYANTTDYFNGQMSQVLLYKGKALTAAEVLSNYNTTKGRFS